MKPVSLGAALGHGLDLLVEATANHTGQVVVEVTVNTHGERVGGTLTVPAEAIHVVGIAALQMATLLGNNGSL